MLILPEVCLWAGMVNAMRANVCFQSWSCTIYATIVWVLERSLCQHGVQSGLPKACQVLPVPSSCQSCAVIQTQASKLKVTTGQPNLQLHHQWYIADGKGTNHPLVCLYLSRHIKVLPAFWSSVAWPGPELSHAVYWVSWLGMMALRLKESNWAECFIFN